MAPGVEDAIRSDTRIGVCVLLATGLIAIMMLASFRWRPAPPAPRDGRIGLATLAELASNWPPGLGDRVEAWFVATPNVMALNALLNEKGGEAKGTLVIWLESPGYGPEVVIAGHGPGAALAETAARDLWIPHRTSRTIVRWLLLHILLPSRHPRFSIRGAGTGGRSNPPPWRPRRNW